MSNLIEKEIEILEEKVDDLRWRMNAVCNFLTRHFEDKIKDTPTALYMVEEDRLLSNLQKNDVIFMDKILLSIKSAMEYIEQLSFADDHDFQDFHERLDYVFTGIDEYNILRKRLNND